MDGVTILNTYMALARSGIAILLLINFFLTAGIICGIALLFQGDFSGSFLIGICITLMLLTFFNVPRTEHIQATLDDSVSYVELTDRYEIVKSDGRIITMIEKEQKDGSNATE